MTVSGKSFWAERIVRAVLQAGNRFACSKTRKKATVSEAKETRWRGKGDEFREVKGLNRT